ncbi:MAG: hypothetical protein LBN00_02230 [Oscillospiraceae bacterium]|nr:hypothetical protein [Oscillospiraceae bacterium]
MLNCKIDDIIEYLPEIPLDAIANL